MEEHSVARLAIFGGTFDPVHSAHLTIARAAADAFRLSRVLFVPAARPPHKRGATHASYEDRCRMVEIACREDKRFEASRLEDGPKPSFSICTIERLRRSEPEAERIFFLIGADAFAEIHTWHRWRDVIREVDFIVVSRPGAVYAIPEGARVGKLEGIELAVSSSDIRRELAEKRYDPRVPAAVVEYIRQRGLYVAEPQLLPG